MMLLPVNIHDLMTGRATGIPKILRAMRANGSPTPKVQTDEERTSFLIRLPVHPQAKSIEPALVVPEVAGEVAKSRLESPLAAKVLICLRQEAAGKTRLAAFLGHQAVSGELHKQIKRLLAEELIEMTRPDKPNSRLQQYRLTKKGTTWLAAPRETATPTFGGASTQPVGAGTATNSATAWRTSSNASNVSAASAPAT